MKRALWWPTGRLVSWKKIVQCLYDLVPVNISAYVVSASYRVEDSAVPIAKKHVPVFAEKAKIHPVDT